MPTSRNKIINTTAAEYQTVLKPARIPHFLADSPQRIFSHGSNIVKTKVHSNHIRHLHTNVPNVDVGGRFGRARDVITETVDGAEWDVPSLEELGSQWAGFPMRRVNVGEGCSRGEVLGLAPTGTHTHARLRPTIITFVYICLSPTKKGQTAVTHEA